MQEKEKLKASQRIKQLEKSHRLIQEKIQHIQKKEQIYESLLRRKRSAVKEIQNTISKGMNNKKKLQQEICAKVKSRQMKNKLNKTLSAAIMQHFVTRETMREKLEKVREGSLSNLKTWKELKVRETELVKNLKNSLNNSMEIIQTAKRVTYIPQNYEGMIKLLLENDINSYN